MPKNKNPEQMREIGRKGGNSTAQRYGASHFRAAAGKRKSFRGGRPAKIVIHEHELPQE